MALYIFSHYSRFTNIHENNHYIDSQSILIIEKTKMYTRGNVYVQSIGFPLTDMD